MKFEKIHNRGQAQLFENPYLEMLTKTNPIVIWSMYIPILSFILYTAHSKFHFSTGSIIGIFIAGVFFWTFFEYLAHRYIFHMISESKRMQRFAYILHGNHHHYPRDRERLFMPPVPSLIISSTILGIMYLIMGVKAFLFFPGFMVGYLMYGTMHYAIHAFNPPFKWMKPLWRNHHLHHYKDEHHGFGVSSTLWDHVFGTMFDLKAEKEDQAKVNELRFEKKKIA
ncbi:MAG: sterol desaturase family protein [Chitinophagaceae bacterium]|nr:sterol desaturase family protein [Chitinophagaceae bacterium]